MPALRRTNIYKDKNQGELTNVYLMARTAQPLSTSPQSQGLARAFEGSTTFVSSEHYIGQKILAVQCLLP